MFNIAAKLRADAAEQRAAASVLVNADDLSTDARKQVAAVVGLTTAAILDAIADLADSMRLTAPTDPLSVRRQQIMEKNDAIRRAAALASATGDWSDFDKLTRSSSGTQERPDSIGNTGS